MEKNILEDAEIVGTALWLKKSSILIIADLHLGIEEMYNAQGIFVPRVNFKHILEMLQIIFRKTGHLKTIIVAGDLKHEFGHISEQEWKEVTATLAYLQHHTDEIILLKGNHDRIVGPIATFTKLKLQNEFFIEKEKILILHGHEIPDESNKDFKKAKVLIIGHEHPAVVLRDDTKAEKFKCFLKGRFMDKVLIVLPSMCSVSEGTNIISEQCLSPFLDQDLSEFECWIVADSTYYFGKLKQLD